MSAPTKLRKTLVLLGTVCVIFVAAAFLIREFRAPSTSVTEQTVLPKQFELLEDTSKEESKDITREVLLSSPLIIFDHGSVTPFTPKEVIAETNRQRVVYGFTALTENKKLDAAAEIKVQDMFEKQYFDHVSPTGQGPDALAHAVSYEYVSIGENLALGTFGDEGALVNAWMNSPGHRANILRAGFKEIGLAVGRGMYQGKQVLIAVQEFGRPIASCPAVSTTLKASIDTSRKDLSALSTTLEAVHKDIDVMSASSTQDQQAYQAKITLYNTEVSEYNALVATIKDKTAQYNDQVRAFNVCLKTSI